MNPYYPKLFEPLTIKRTTFRNRIFSAPNMFSHMDFKGRPDDSMIAYYGEKARGGCAVVTIGDTPVDKEHAASNPRSFAIDEENLPMLSELVNAIHEGGAIASHELNHAGFTASKEANGGDDSWMPWGPVDDTRWDGVAIHGMTKDEIMQVVKNFGEAAEKLKRAGYDMCLIHGGHGWLLDQFLSPLYNTRTDEFGGSLENRAKVPLLVIEEIRKRCGENFLIEYRMSGSEEIEGGLSAEEGIAFAKMIDGKVDLIHVSAGLDIEEEQAVHTHPTIFLPHGVNVHYAAAIKEFGVKTPVVTIGGINTPELAEEILSEGKADVVAFARALIADPYFPDKAKHGHPEDIIPCLRCLDCLTGLHEGRCLKCAVNSMTAREERYRSLLTIHPKAHKRVLVVGGGPGGMQAAITASDRGHSVTLAEKTDALGGLLKFTDYDDLKIDLRRLKDYLITQVKKRPIDVQYNTFVTKDWLQANKYDSVILAVGSQPAFPPIDGLDDPDILHATDIYTRMDQIKENVCILGGGLVGCETGLYLAEHGHKVTIVEMQDEIAPEANWMHKEGMMQAFAKAPITLRPSLKVSRVKAGQGVYAINADGKEEFLPAQSIVYSLGMRPLSDTVSDLRDVYIDTECIGDCVSPRKAKQAMEEGFWAAARL